MGLGTVWQEGAERFMKVEHLSQENSLHPAVLEMIRSYGGHRLLDFGCGDGRILDSIPNTWDVDAYDPSAQMRALAERRAGARLNRLFDDLDSIVDKYDVVLLGMVLLCIPEEDEVFRVLRKCANAMTLHSKLVITTTHPCFRNYRFSNFSTDFAEGRTFNYMENGCPFEVTLRDPGTSAITFTDYHWTIEFTISALRRAGLLITALKEVADDPNSRFRNEHVPAFLIFECERSK